VREEDEKNLYLESFIFSWEELNKILQKMRDRDEAASEKQMREYYTFLKRMILDLDNWMKMNNIQLTDQEAQFYDNLPDGFVFTDDKGRQEKHLFRQNQLILIKCKKRMLEVFGE